MRMTFILSAVIAISSTVFAASAFADKLCLKSTVNKKTFKVTTQSTLAAACPAGYTAIADTSFFVGATGSQGAAGATGAQGEGSIDILDSGQTISGHGVVTRSGCRSLSVIAFPAAAPLGLTQEDIIIVEPPPSECNPCTEWGLSNCPPCIQSAFTANSSLCTGTVNFPTAPAGKVCVYFKPGFFRVANMGVYSSGRFGFTLSADYQYRPGSPGCGDPATYEPIWAYKAP